MKSLLWVIAQAYGLITVVLVSLLVARSVADALDVPAVPATIVEWTCAAAVGVGTWRWWRRFCEEFASAGLAEKRAAGEALRHNDPDRYRDLLNSATETLAVTDPDRFVGVRIAAAREEEPREEEPGAELRIRSRRWTASTAQQAMAVDRLTEQLGQRTLVHSLEDGSAEVVGEREDVGVRYRVDDNGGVELLSEDDTLVTSSRLVRRIARTGLLMFIGSAAVFALDPSVFVRLWLLPFTLVGFALIFLFLAGAHGPKLFVNEGEWYQYGKRWQD